MELLLGNGQRKYHDSVSRAKDPEMGEYMVTVSDEAFALIRKCNIVSFHFKCDCHIAFQVRKEFAHLNVLSINIIFLNSRLNVTNKQTSNH